MRMKRFCVVLMLLAVVLTSGQVRAQDSEIITVTGFYIRVVRMGNTKRY